MAHHGIGTACLLFLPLLLCLSRPAAGTLLGAPQQVSTSDPAVLKAAAFAQQRYNLGSNGVFLSKVLRIVSAQKQVVEGIKYILEVEMGDTVCKKGITSELESCDLHPDPNVFTKLRCLFVIWDCSWKNKTILVKQECHRAVLLYPSPMLTCKGHHFFSVDLVDNVRITNESLYLMSLFKEFLVTYNKKYKDEKETQQRFEIFLRNMAIAEQLQKMEQGTAEYGVTKFSDLTGEEFQTLYLNPLLSKHASRPMKKAQIPTDPAPAEWDWREHGAVTAVKNQMWRTNSGLCFFFRLTLVTFWGWFVFAVSELVDCDRLDQACGGGLPCNAYEAIEKLGGLETEGDYSYQAHKQACSFSANKVAAYINSSVDIASDEEEMARWLAKNGPVSAALNAFAMQLYKKGISHPYLFLCMPWWINHAVLLVGYGARDNVPFWAIKNSWGEDWGEQGYYYLYRGSNVCGITTLCSSAVVN
uniref:Cathepsin F n=1 Tax=Latimeria chalumnae TaxID=7897 RepID=H3AKB0_LATCH